MTEKRANLEMIAPSVDEAIANGLVELGLPREAVDVEVLDEGNRGLFGLGSRQARVRLTVKNAAPVEPEEPEITYRTEPWPGKDLLPAKKAEPKPAAPRRSESRPAPEQPKPEKASVLPATPEEEQSLRLTEETVRELLGHMEIEADISVTLGEQDDRQSRPPVMVDITGHELSILIGKRAETLGALQYIVSLIVSKKIGHNVTIVIDVEKYRQRRETQLRQLARRMADQAVKTGRRQVLEPMPPSERRIVHMELRQNPQVRTESIGEEPYRKVTISLSDE